MEIIYGYESTMVEIDVIRIQREVSEEFMTECWRIPFVKIFWVNAIHIDGAVGVCQAMMQ